MSSIKPCPKSFSFTNPETKQKEGGTVLREEVIERSSGEHRDYYVVAQLLQWEDDGFFIRFGYYLKPRGAKETEWVWGSQTTAMINVESVDTLLEALPKLMETYEQLQQK